MKTTTWLLLLIIGLMIDPVYGAIVVGLYAFNYITAIIFAAISDYQQGNENG